MNVIESHGYKGCTIEIVADETAECPLNDNGATLCRIAHWHRRYNIGEPK